MTENTTYDGWGHHSHESDRNTDMFFAVADVLDFLPETYDQTEWGQNLVPSEDEGDYYENELGKVEYDDCRTTACVAGWVAILAGWHPTINYVGGGENGPRTPIINYGEVSMTPLTDGTGRNNREIIRDVADLAQEILQITDDEANAMFESSPQGCVGDAWTGDELRRIGKGANIFEIQEEEE